MQPDSAPPACWYSTLAFQPYRLRQDSVHHRQRPPRSSERKELDAAGAPRLDLDAHAGHEGLQSQKADRDVADRGHQPEVVVDKATAVGLVGVDVGLRQPADALVDLLPRSLRVSRKLVLATMVDGE